jgi:hypothetical protein
VSRYQAPRYLADGDALGIIDVDRVLECYNIYGRTRPLVVAHRSGVQLVPWRTAERLELAMLDMETNSNDWGMATMTGGTDTQSRFVIPGGASGWWCVSAFAGVPNPSSGTHSGVWRLEICKTPKYSGVTDYQDAQIELAREDSMTLGTTDTHCNLAAGTIMYCDEGDEVFARVYQNTGTDIQIANSSGGTSPPDCQISMVWLGVGTGQTLAAFDAATIFAAAQVPDADEWTKVANQAFYVCDDRPTVKVGKDSGTSVSSATITAIAMNSEASFPNADAWGWHSTVTNNSRITVPSTRGGLYLVGGSIAGPHGATSTCRRLVYLRVNGTRYIAAEDLRQTFTGVTAGPVISVGPLLVQLSASDYLEATYYQDSGGAVTVGDDNFDSNNQPCNAQLYMHQVQEGTLATTTSFTANGYLKCNDVLTHTWWNTYMRDNGVALVKDVRAVCAVMSGTQSVASGNWTPISWGSTEFDNCPTGSGYWAAGSPTFFTIPSTAEAGWYLVGGGLEFAPTGATRRMVAVRIQKNVSTTVAKRGATVESAAIASLNIPATLVYLEASEFLTFDARHNVGSNINVGGATDRMQAYFWMLRVCNPVAYDPA